MVVRYSSVICLLLSVTFGTGNTALTKRTARSTVDISDVPYVSQIRDSNGNIICTGAILNFLYILTTASCVQDVSPSEIKILVGSSGLNDGTEYDVKEVIPHEYFNRLEENQDESNDIALVKLSSYMRYSTKVRPIPIPEIEDEYDLIDSDDVTSSGWSIQNTLSRVKKQLIERSQCIQSYGLLNIVISNDVFCAETVDSTDDETDAVLSPIDKGWPLVQNSILIGLKIVSIQQKPDVYIRISKFISWIEENNTDY